MTMLNFVQINNRNLEESIGKINNFADSFIIGFEVVNPEIIQYLDVNIDPQHTGVKWYDKTFEKENVSASKWLLSKLPTLPQHNNITCVIEKPDMDSVAAAALYVYADEIAPMEHGFDAEYAIFCKLCDRVKQIDRIDCGIGNADERWNPEYYKTQVKEGVTQFNVLGSMCSDFKTLLAIRVELMRRWLVTGELPVHYLEQQQKEFEKINDAKVDFLHGVTCVQTKARNVSSIIYSHSPFGVAYNDEFPTPNGTIQKFTIMSFNSKDYLDFASLLSELTQLEEGWGGNLNAGIIGSPFGGTQLTPETVCSIVARHVK